VPRPATLEIDDHSIKLVEDLQTVAPREWKDRVQALRTIGPMLKMVYDASPRLALAISILRVLTALIPLVILAISKYIIDGVVGAVSLQRSIPHEFWLIVGVEFTLMASMLMLDRAIAFCNTLLADRFAWHGTVKIIEQAVHLDLGVFEDPQFYERLARARVQASDRAAMIPQLGRVFQLVVTAISLSVGIFLFSPWLVLVLVAATIPSFFGETHYAFLGYSLNFRQTNVRRYADHIRWVTTTRENASEIRAFGMSPFFKNLFSKLSASIYDQNRLLATRKFIVTSSLSLLAAAGQYGAYAYVIWKAVMQDISIGALTFLAGAIAGASRTIQETFLDLANVADQALFVGDMLDFLRLKPQICSPPDAINAPCPFERGIEFCGVSFRYPGSDSPVLDCIDLHIKPGENIALVGLNGSGKSTLIKLLLRLYDPTDGKILLDGVDLRCYDIESLRKQFTVIFQDFVRYNMTALDNIAISQYEKRSDRDAIEDAAKKSLAHEVIKKLPNGYEQMLGCYLVGSLDLSGGEWQRVAIARAYLRSSQFLILDEPTAALDASAEPKIFQQFQEFTKGRSSLFISHRFSTVRTADRILVLKKGKIIEEGSHEQLMERGGEYAALFLQQATGYQL
jgi:ATP-binding cassette subfamily B protein